jgi:hypothetical protein
MVKSILGNILSFEDGGHWFDCVTEQQIAHTTTFYILLYCPVFVKVISGFSAGYPLGELTKTGGQFILLI